MTTRAHDRQDATEPPRHDADARKQIGATEDTKDTKQIDKGPSQASNEISSAVIGAAIDVHRALGPGYLESIYERALAIELHDRGIPFEQQVLVPVVYRGLMVGEHRLDLLVGGLVVVEIKAVASLAAAHYSQAISYLKATNLDLALLLNFNARTIIEGLKRIAR